MSRLLHRFLLLLLLTAAPALAQNTLHVPQDFPTIQSALNASSPGDTVLVAPGTYTENLIFPHAVTLQSTAGAASTTLDGNQAAPVLTLSGQANANTTISGFTITRGLAISSSHNAAGIFLSQSGATLANNTFTNNSGDNVGVFFGTVSVLNSSLSTAPSTFGSGCDGGTGIAVTGSSAIYDSTGATVRVTISGNTIAGNSSSCSGTGIILSTDSFTTPHLVTNNTIRDSALGLRFAAANGIVLEQNLIFDNLQGALVLSSTATPSTDPAQTLLINNTVVNNLNSPDPNDASPSEIHLLGTVATTAFLNNILVGTTAYPVLLCETDSPSLNQTPLLLDHTDLFNTTGSSTGLYAGDCFPSLSSPLTSFGNLSADPHFAGSTDLHLTSASPAIDAGTNSADLALLTDLDGNPRPLDATNLGYPTIDMGAYEFSGPADATPIAVTLASSAYLTPAAIITLTATATQPSQTHTNGTITFLQTGSSLGTVALNSQGVAALPVPLSTLGVYAFTATYTPPNNTLAPTTSPILFVDVTTSATPVTPTILSLSATSSTITTAQTTLLTIHLATTGNNSTIPPGNVHLTDNGTALADLTPDPISGQVTYLITFSTAGTHTLLATYGGTSTFGPGFASISLAVSPLTPTTLTVSASPASPTAGQTVTLTAHLGSTTTSGNPGPIPPGALSLYDNSTFLTTLQPDSAGAVTYTLPSSTTAGAHIYIVRYAGTTIYGPASSSTNLTLPATLSTTLRLQSSANPGTLDTPLTLTATVTSSSVIPTGSVRFADGTTTLATLPLTSGQATYTTSSLALGSHPITATYLPDPAFSASAASVFETIQGIPTQLSATPGTYTTGLPFSFLVTATVPGPGTYPIAPAGVLTVSEGSTLLVTVPLAPATASIATVSLTLTTPGVHHLTLKFTSPSGDFLPSQCGLPETLNSPAPITLSVSALPANPVIGISVTLTAQAASAEPLPTTGTITFLDGATVLTTLPLTGTATYTLSTLTVGLHTLSAVLRDSHAATLATSSPFPLTVHGITSTLALTAAPSPSALAGAPVTLSATLSSTSPTPHIPAGTLTFLDGVAVLGTATPDAAGRASLVATALSPGTHALAATYSGDGTLAPATASALTETILANATVTTLASLPPTTSALNPIRLSAQVTSPTSATPIATPVCSPACAPTTVTFVSGSTVLGISPVDSSGHATFTLAPHAGTLAVAAQFSGSPLFAPSTSSISTSLVVPATTALSLSASPNPLYQNGSTTLTSTLTAAVPASIPLTLVNPVTISSGASVLGALTTTAATLSYTPTSTGTLAITATYPGSPDLAPASTAVTITVLPSDLTLSVQNTSLSLRTTHHTATTVTLTASGAMSDTVDLSCPGAPYLVTCTFSPPSPPVSADGAAAGSATTTIQLAIDTDFILDWASATPPGATSALLALTLPPGFLLFLAFPRRRTLSPRQKKQTPPLTRGQHTPHPRTTHTVSHPGMLPSITPQPNHPSRSQTASSRPILPNLLAALLLCAGSLLLSSCSGRQPGHTPPGTYTLTISAHARAHNLTRTAPITLFVKE